MKLTIFTPTYNRGEKLLMVFDSLLVQSCLDFEWLVIDDGSIDETQKIVASFCDRASFPIRYYRKENGGKHTAYNLALEQSRGDWFLCLDSDDLLVPDAVRLLLEQMKTVSDIQGVIAYKVNFQGEMIGDLVPESVERLYLYELGIRYGCGGDYVFVYETNLARKYPSPVFFGERFVPESLMLDRLGRECLMGVVRKPLMLCEYQPDGYSANARRLLRENPQAYCAYYSQRIDLVTTLKERVDAAGRYHCHLMFAAGALERYKGKHRFLTAFCMPLGCLYWLYYKLFCGF